MLHSEANGYGSYRIQGDPGIKVNYWTPENPTNEFPRPEKVIRILPNQMHWDTWMVRI